MKPDDYSHLGENLSQEKRKRDVKFDVAGKRLKLKYQQLIYEKTASKEEEKKEEESSRGGDEEWGGGE